MSEVKLTDQFEFTSYPKPLKVVKHKAVRNYRDFGYTLKKNKSAKKVAYKRKFHIPKEKTRSQLIKDLDKLFSNHLKAKSHGRCVRCGRVGTGVSHYWSRKHIGTRWDTDNCDWVCWFPCHDLLEHEKQGEYMDFMIKKLGQKKYDEIKIKAISINKFSTVDIKLMIQNFDKIWF